MILSRKTKSFIRTEAMAGSALATWGSCASILGAVAVALATPHLAVAQVVDTQDPGPQGGSAKASAPDATPTGLEEVIVTARKRSESLLKVPIAVSVLTAKDLQATGSVSLTDIATYTPGLTLNNDGSDHVDRAVQNLFIRGMSSGVSPSVSVFIDGAPVPTGFIPGVSDAARVEILKGPQSAFFGRETFGGAVNIVTKDPTNHYDYGFDTSYGSDNTYDLKGSIEGPIIADKLTARLSVRDYSTDGQYKSSLAPYADLGGQSTKSGSLELKFTPTSDLTIKAFGSVFEDKDGPAPAAKFGAANYNCNGGGGGANNYICGTLPLTSGTRLPIQTEFGPLFQSQVIGNAGKTLNPLFSDLIDSAGFERQAFHAHVNIDYQIPGTSLVLTSLSSGNKQKSQDNVNLDDQDTSSIFNFYTLFGIPNIYPTYTWNSRVQLQASDAFQEFRLTSDQTKRFHYTVGASYSWSSTASYIDGLFPFGTASFGGGGAQVDDVEGIFGSATYNITNKLSFSLEGRYQRDAIKVYNRALGVPDTVSTKTSSDDFLPRVIAQYQFMPNAMVYATYSRGVNPPVFNNALVGKPAQILQEFSSIYGVGVAVQPEYLDNYEVGLKGSFFDGRLRFAGDVYFDTWDQQILSQFVSVPGIPGYLQGAPDAETVQVNGGRTDLVGVEIDSQFAVTRDLTLSFSGAYNGTDVRKYPNYHCAGDACTAGGGVTDITGNQLPNVPEFSANFAATYTGQLTPTLDWYTRGDFIYKGSEYTDLSNLTKIGDSKRFNFRAGITHGAFSAEAFVLNAFNDKAYTSINGTTDIDGQPNAYGAYPLAEVVGLPVLRQFGFRLRRSF